MHWSLKKPRCMQQQGKIEITLDYARQSNVTEREQSVLFHSSLNLIQELFSIKGKDPIAVSLYVPDTG